jgi:hypothetical protein
MKITKAKIKEIIIEEYQKILLEKTIIDSNGQGVLFSKYFGLGGRGGQPDGLPAGLWVFLWPFFDHFFIYGAMSDIDGRFDKKTKRPATKMSTFRYKGPIFTKIDNPLAKDIGLGRWNLTHTDYLEDIVGKTIAKDKAQIMGQFRDYYEKYKPKDQTFDQWMSKAQPYMKNPYGMMSQDHYEFFIPKHPHILNKEYFPDKTFKKV